MTKKITIALLFSASFFLSTHAQIKKNSILLGGQIAFISSNIDYSTQPNQKEKDAAFNVSLAKAFKENSAFGLNVTYQPSTLNNFFSGSEFIDQKTNQYYFGVFYKRYKNLAKDFYFFAQPEVDYVTGRNTVNDTLGINLEKVKVSGPQLTLMPGISYKIFNKFHLEILIPNIVTIQYASKKDNTPTTNVKQKTFVFKSSLNSSSFDFLGVGFRFIF